jgi:putative phage-type endonuclease
VKYDISEDQLKANREEYAKFRSTRIGGSDVPVILNESPFETPYGLWLKKTGRAKNEFAPSLNAQLGIKYEDTMRSDIELKLDLDFKPQIFVHDVYSFLMTSLDGWNEETKTVLEIKTVLGASTYEKALEGKISESYISQVQQQLMVAQGVKTLFYVGKLEPFMGDYRIVDKVLIEATPDKAHQERILAACIEFYHFMTSDTPPALTERDAVLVSDKDIIELLSDKLNKNKIIDLCLKTKEHNFYDIGGIAKLKKDTNGHWRMTFKK